MELCLTGKDCSSAKAMKNVRENPPNKKKLSGLSDSEQYFLFKASRNMAADRFHVFTTVETKTLAEDFARLCQGNTTSIFTNLATLKTATKNFARGRNIDRKLKEGSGTAKTKLFNQIVYFLLRAESFFEQDEVNEGLMALVGAGNCARDVNMAGIFKNDSTSKKKMTVLMTVRKLITHPATSKGLKNPLMLLAKNTRKEIPVYIAKVKEAAKTISCIVDVKSISETAKKAQAQTDNPPSPRAYVRILTI